MVSSHTHFSGVEELSIIIKPNVNVNIHTISVNTAPIGSSRITVIKKPIINITPQKIISKPIFIYPPK
jgi:hypothetical protein